MPPREFDPSIYLDQNLEDPGDIPADDDRGSEEKLRELVSTDLPDVEGRLELTEMGHFQLDYRLSEINPGEFYLDRSLDSLRSEPNISDHDLQFARMCRYLLGEYGANNRWRPRELEEHSITNCATGDRLVLSDGLPARYKIIYRPICECRTISEAQRGYIFLSGDINNL